MKELPKPKFAELGKDRQATLVRHFEREFCLTRKQAKAECASLEGEDLETHLDAAEYGYI